MKYIELDNFLLTVNSERLESSATDNPKCLTGIDMFAREMSETVALD